jgi:hypothetical protein
MTNNIPLPPSDQTAAAPATPAPTSAPLPIGPAPAAPTTALPFPFVATPPVTAASLEAKNKKETAKGHSKAKQAAIDIRKLYWPEVKDEDLWLLDKDSKKRGGFAQVPRTLSLVMNIINDITKRKYGKSVPAGKTYLVLWLHHFSEGLVKIQSEPDAAYEAGYDGQRNVSTFRAHMKILQEVGFIDFRRGPKGPMQYVLMRSPYKVVKKLHDEKDEHGVQLVSDEQYAALIERVNDIGSRDELED